VGAVKEVTQRGVRFADGKEEQFDAIILATGYRSNVPSWLKVNFSLPSTVLKKMKRTRLFVGRALGPAARGCRIMARHPLSLCSAILLPPLPFSCMPAAQAQLLPRAFLSPEVPPAPKRSSQ